MRRYIIEESMQISITHHSERVDTSTDYPFGRKNLASNLRKIFLNAEGGYVLAIDAKWGEGKTAFVHKLILDLRAEKNLIPIYYDAFSNDFSNDTFLSIGSTVYQGVKEHYAGGEDSFKQAKQIEHLKTVTKNAAIELVKVGTDLGVKALTGGLLGGKELTELSAKFVNDTTFGTLELDVDRKFNAYKELKNRISDYVKALESIGNSGDKVIFFIDELDRCRPDFAVEVLEKIKHLFPAKNVVFVLCYNKTQLIKIISNVYGVSETDSYKYLEKFVHIEAPLPSLNLQNESESLPRIFDEFISQFNIDLTRLNVDPEYVKSKFVELCSSSRLNLNLREIERAFSYVSFCIATLSKDAASELLPCLLPAAMCRVKNDDLFNKLKDGHFNSMNFRDELNWVHDFFGKYYGNKANWTASNVYVVEEFKQACDLISMFKTPDQVSEEHKII
ncbi:hypothetical protein DLH88_24195 [Vibrio parahaemolyticus]|nr:hypothetical protein [Vibrio parahaemolyticus]EGR3154899.1 hypothetical protein [Vibrio parahaemolyticus]